MVAVFGRIMLQSVELIMSIKDGNMVIHNMLVQDYPIILHIID